MIDISLLAPAGQAPAPNGAPVSATTSKDSAPGAQGFLRLFEIVLDGMPRPVQPEFGEALATATPAAAGQLDLLAGAPGSVEALASDPNQLPDAAAQQIANLLQGLGFDVDANQIMALGPLDRMQLDQAMEFLQRGLQAGMGTSELLENASFLMPREWDYQGPQSASTPRSEGLSVSSPEASGIDPAQILAATEAVRQMLATLMPVAVPSQAKTSQTLEVSGVSAAPSANATIGAGESAATTPTTANSIPAVVANATLPTPSKDASSPTPVASETATESDPNAMSDSDIPAMLPVGARAVPGRQERPSAAQARNSAIQITQASPADPTRSVAAKTAQAQGPEAPATAAPAPESGARNPDGSSVAMSLAGKAHAPVADARIATAEGVKPGSLASEFIGRQVLEKVDVHLKQGKRELTVRLWPEELGEVRLSLRMGEADKLDARILVQTEGVRQALLDATPQLREALARHGMEMGRLSVSVDSGRSEAQMADGERRDPNGREGGRETPRRGWREQEMEYAGALALGVDSGIRDGRNTLDMWS